MENVQHSEVTRKTSHIFPKLSCGLNVGRCNANYPRRLSIFNRDIKPDNLEGGVSKGKSWNRDK